MRREARHSGVGAAGFSLVELIVVLAVIGILAGISIPVVRMFSQNDLQRGVRELNSLLRGAKVYASTYNVNTAVIYQIAPFPVDDTILGQTVRVLSGATVVYQLPKDAGTSYAGLYVPTPEFGGDFRPFIPGYCVLLQKPPDSYDRFPENGGLKYTLTGDQALDYTTEYFVTADKIADKDKLYDKFVPNAADSGTQELGLAPVPAYLAYIPSDPVERAAEYTPLNIEVYLAHVFDGKGGLTFDTLRSPPQGQRFRILFAPLPDQPREERMWSTTSFDDIALNAWKDDIPQAQGTMGYQGQEVTIYRSTGRIKTGSLQP